MGEIKQSKPKRLKSDTRLWSGGRVRFSVIGWEGKPDRNYIIFEKNFFGNSRNKDQKFIVHEHDWKNLRQLIDGEFSDTTGWEKQISVVNQESLSKLILEDPESIEKIISNPNILKLSNTSLESLDRLAIRLYDIKTEKIDLILKELSTATKDDVLKFSTLLDDLKLNQISTMASLVYQKIKVIDLLEDTCSDITNSERNVHEIFEKNSWLMGKDFEIVQSDKSLANYLDAKISQDPNTKKRPDIIAKIVPCSQDIVLIELKAPGIKLRAENIGQVLEYKAIIKNLRPSTKKIHCFLYGYEKANTFMESNDVIIKTFSEIISELRQEYKEYQNILESGKEIEEEIPVIEERITMDEIEIPVIEEKDIDINDIPF